MTILLWPQELQRLRPAHPTEFVIPTLRFLLEAQCGGSGGVSLQHELAEQVFHLAQQTARRGFALDVHGFAELA